MGLFLRRTSFAVIFLALAGCQDMTYWGGANNVVDGFIVELIDAGYCKNIASCQQGKHIFIAPYSTIYGDQGIDFEVYGITNEKAITWLYGACMRKYIESHKKMSIRVSFHRKNFQEDHGWLFDDDVFSKFNFSGSR